MGRTTSLLKSIDHAIPGMMRTATAGQLDVDQDAAPAWLTLLAALTPADLAWLTAHGWTDPRPPAQLTGRWSLEIATVAGAPPAGDVKRKADPRPPEEYWEKRAADTRRTVDWLAERCDGDCLDARCPHCFPDTHTASNYRAGEL